MQLEEQQKNIQSYSALKQKKELEFSSLAPMLEVLYPLHFSGIIENSESMKTDEYSYSMAKTPKEVYEVSNTYSVDETISKEVSFTRCRYGNMRVTWEETKTMIIFQEIWMFYKKQTCGK